MTPAFFYADIKGLAYYFLKAISGYGSTDYTTGFFCKQKFLKSSR
jgi:hypothetical protein